ncbi:ATP-binding protein [uncultured Phascolarctobacterium sp.]|uniref:ATP-binding protein n=1 Tax=uncultured Phascolarctobacterium sp. TaxID=512296 RepID=UPI0025D1F0FD|nr:ATP-binding protein [uncultured Phascolarctobacterium sp.]
MKIKRLAIKNFRGYHGETSIEFEDLTAFVGKNDIGKSSIMEALDLFFNDGKGVIKLDKDDVNIDARGVEDLEICISICFCDLPERIIIDATNETSLAAEYLLNPNNQLEVIKKYPNAGSAKVFIRALHPTNPFCADLLQKRDSELRQIIESNQIICDDRTRNAVMRNSIRQYFGDNLQLDIAEIDVTKGDTKSIWEKLQKYLPLYSLFQSDRKNSDGDNEVQDPLKEAVKEILHDEELQRVLNFVAATVETKLREVSARTLEKLREMSPDIASTLNPVIPVASSLKWGDVFKNVSITSDENIPINKRGSGSKRLILLNFFRAEVERRQSEINAPSVIYAIEEPETSQHSENQKKLIKALILLAAANNTQVLITTHSATIVKQLGFNNIRIIRMDNTQKIIENTLPNQLPYPSLNEVNYLAFSELSEEYHNELYGYIVEQGLLEEYSQDKSKTTYIRLLRNGVTRTEQKIMTEYIRHQIHHPENTHNVHFTENDLRTSIEDMRSFIQSKT